MKTKTKIVISTSIVFLMFFVLSLMAVAIFAAQKQSVSTDIVVAYNVQGVSGSVSAKYYKGNTSGVDMTDDGTSSGNTEISFEMSEKQTTKKLMPQEEQLNLKGQNNFVVFEYKFYNSSNMIDYNVNLNFDATINNFSAFKFETANQPIGNFDLIDRALDDASNFTTSTFVGCEQYTYLYIKFETTNKAINANFEGNFNFELTVYEGEEIANTFNLLENGNTYTLLGLNEGVEVADLNIPDHYYGKKITSISPNAFAGNKTIKTLTIPEDIVAIGDGAFADCTNLTRIDFNAVEFTTQPTVESCIFKNAGIDGPGIEVFINSSVKVVPDNLFVSANSDAGDDFESITEFPNITSVTINKRVKNTGNASFQLLINLASLNIENGVEEIGNASFSYCPNLKTVVIPASVKVLGVGAFGLCPGLTRIEYNAVSVQPLTEESIVFFASGTDDAGIDVVFGEGVKEIPDYLFDYSLLSEELQVQPTNIKSVSVAKSVERVGTNAFANSTIKTLTFDEDCEVVIFPNAFANCASLTEINIPKRTVGIGDEAFANCLALTKINYNAMQLSIPFTETSNIFINAGKNSSGVQVVIGDDAVNVPEYLFYSAVENVTTDSSTGAVLTKEVNTENVPNITSLKIGKNVKNIGPKAFTYLAYLTKIEYGATNLNDLDFTSRIFEGAGILGTGIDLTITEGVETIPNFLFVTVSDLSLQNVIEAEVAKLKTVTVSSTVERIGLGSFAYCPYLTNVNWGAVDCEFGITTEMLVTLEPLSSDFNEIVERLESLNSNICFMFPLGFPETMTRNIKIVFEDGVNSVPDFIACPYYAEFSETMEITANIEITFANSITKIGNMAFACNNIDSVVLPTNLKEIGMMSFANCWKFTELNIPDSVQQIGFQAFHNCRNVENLILGKNIKQIGIYAFSFMYDLKQVKYNILDLAPTLFYTIASDTNVFEGTNLMAFSASGETSGFDLVFGEGVKVVRGGLFVVSDINSVQFSSTITTIEKMAFYLSGIKDIVIPTNIVSIEDQALLLGNKNETVTIESAVIYSLLEEYSSSRDYVAPDGGLIGYADVIKISKDIEDGSNKFLNSSKFTRDDTSDPDYVIFTR